MTSPSASGWVARGRASILALALVPSLLQGCAAGHQYDAYRDQSDQCYYARAPLIALGDDFERTVMGSTATGAAVGGLGGAALGAAIGGSWKAALIGAAAGALAGSLGGYLSAKRKQAQTQSAILASIDQDAVYDTRAVNSASVAIRDLIVCRNGQTSRIEAAYTNKTMTRLQAIAAYRDIQARSDQDDKLITALLGAADERGTKYVSARADVLTLREPVQAASPATQQLVTARQSAQAEEQNYQRFRGNMNQRVNELVNAIG